MTAPLIVLGSANRDLVVLVSRHPLPGETLLATGTTTGVGGKGANQALAAARAGATPSFVGAVGADAEGDELVQALADGGVDVTHVRRSMLPTGLALITVSDAGENTIVVAQGANASLEPEQVAGDVAATGQGPVLLAQLEVPLDAVEAAARTAGRSGGRFVLNLSPAREVPDSLLEICDPLVVNESEAALVAGRDAASVESVDDALELAQALAGRCRSIVITLGGDGAVFGDQSGVTHVPAEKVKVIDTTGAGDAFVGTLAARLARGEELADAVEAGLAAGTAAVQHLGAQPPRA
ncbi:ribokinase [Ruicaihuangia caeni]|uniref:Ribokinase n=1 Tax=Ruicaihuangia caeni TaxID=3042517 RepID=A0AAW6T5W7_9MICO|nr:ribokinase [Klugiella sp. YN-L-19]MDI2097553.1 ribokinase [Klugiella sp. YN-L-19]